MKEAGPGEVIPRPARPFRSAGQGLIMTLRALRSSIAR